MTHRSKPASLRAICSVLALSGAAGACALAGVTSCGTKVVTVDVPLVAYVPVACGDASGAPVTYTGLGDFPATAVSAEERPLGSAGFVLAALSPDTREVVLSPVGDAGWSAAARVPDSGPVELLTLPQARACPLSRRVGLAGEGTTAGMLDATHALLVGGTAPPFVIDLGTGAVTQLPAGLALSPARQYATVTPFGSGALFAGGQDPTAMGEAQQTAVVYTPGAGGTPGSFASPPIVLSQQRTQHAAVVLPDGRTLLVGGTGDKALVTGLEVVDPADPTHPTVLPASLTIGRTHPTAFLLPTGQVFVGGGFDAAGAPVATVEWIAADLGSVSTQVLCHAGTAQGFAPTEGGAVVAVIGPDAPTAACSNVHVLRPDSVAEAPALAPPPLVVTLFPGAEASPVLVTDSGTLRFDPWTATFAALGASAAGLSLPTSAFLAPSPGLALWLAEDNDVWLLRFDTHGTFATDIAHGPYLVTDDTFTAPDRLAGTDVSFDPATGAVLSNGATVWVTDATFAEVTASVVVLSGGSVRLVVRDPMGGEVVCAASGVMPHASAQLVRSGASVSMSVAGGAATPCAGSLASAARVSIGVRGPAVGEGAVAVQALTVTR